MNTIFHPARFANLMAKHIREHFRSYLMSLLVYSAVILFIFLVIILFTSHRNPVRAESQFLVFILTFYLGVFIFAGNIFSAFNHPHAVFSAMMLPASLFEKYLLRWLVSLVGFFVSALTVFHLSQSIVMEYLKTQDILMERFFLWEAGSRLPSFKWLVLIYCFFHAAAFLGSVTFSKRTVIVTGLVVSTIIAAFVYYNFKLSSYFLDGTAIPLPFLRVRTVVGNELVQIIQNNNELLGIISLGGLIILIWLCAFFKLKEREV